MYPILCQGRYPVPEKEGSFEVWGVLVTPTTVNTDFECRFRDDWGANSPDFVLDPNKNTVFHAIGTGDNPIFFETKFKTRKGLIATTLTNCEAVVYAR